MSNQTDFLNRRLHSLLGVIPVGFFLLEHFYTNYFATQGKEAFEGAVNFLWGIPILRFLEIFLIFIPLIYHAFYGLYIVFRAKNNVSQFGTFRNYMFVIQRVTGVITLIFILWHLWQIWFQTFLDPTPTANELATETANILSNNITAILYGIGVISAVFHFCNGMWSFLVSWGVTVGPRAQLVSTWVWIVAFVVLSYFGISSIVAFHDPNFANNVSALQ
ncbi:succinate dehydrogenase cytochrome b558 subunit [Shimazuella sp. AN120528]|uniref:succinate dehydrogenase cytochrome b558 subunit n=1 Tax=Shimazuella soli TaxID=1892854 RepID=UPI001F0CEA49|nr:succinate dehydrogenase cytochrome b558 subunit [Shimazuella soli]